MAPSATGFRCSSARRPIAFGLLCVMAFTGGCSTKVGTNSSGPNGSNGPPEALITPIGFKATSGAGTSAVAITARSGSAVILSGKDSNGFAVAIAGFQWSQTGGPPLPLAPDVGSLQYQTANTVEFTAPEVDTPTMLTFQLKVTNALNVSSSATANVTITPANDPDEFLVPTVVDNPTPPRRFVVAVAANAGLTPQPGAAMQACVTVNRSLSYTSRDGTLHDGVHQPMLTLPTLASLQANAVWNSSVGGVATGSTPAALSAALQSTTNPRVTFDVPVLNDVELFAMFNQPAFNANGVSTGIPAAAFNQSLIPSDIDTAKLYLSISTSPGSCDGKTAAPVLAGVPLTLGIYAPGATAPALTNGGSGPLESTADALLTALYPTTPVETLAGVSAYYAKIDPPWPGVTQGATKSDLNTWLDDNCFDHTQSDYGTGAAGVNGAHAGYTNNFDLGFGRDMYFIKCAANHTDANGNITAHAGDMAAVVINYASLEQVALGQDVILAVAMEFQGEGHSNGNCGAAGSTCFTKFYVFAPNDETGVFQRVSSANFDRRGEKYVPGACLSCHGGTVTDATYTAANSENVDAAFMPWDLDALLYSDTDPAYTGYLIGQAPFTRAVQEPNLLKLNALAWQTYQVPELKLAGTATPCGPSTTGCVDRFAANRALLVKWYGWCGPVGTTCATAHPYDDNGPTSANDWPTATPAGAPTTTPTGAPNDLYHSVYAHHCRSCHTQNNNIKRQFDDFATFSANLIPGNTSTSLQPLLYTNAQMPLARLTMDRFWVDYFGSSTSAAQTLATYINDQTGAARVAVATDSLGTTEVVPPGAPVLMGTAYANVDPNSLGAPITATQIKPAAVVSGVRFNGARIDFSPSLFVATYQSSLCLSQTIPAPPASCTAQSLVGDEGASPSFSTTAAGYYNLSMSAVSPSGKSTPESQPPFIVDVQRHGLDTACAPQNATVSIPYVGSSSPSSGTVVNLSGCSAAQLGDTPLLQVETSPNTWVPAPPNTTTPYAIASADYTITINPCIINPPLVAGSLPTVQGCNIVLAFAPTATAETVPVNYRVLDQFDNLASAVLTDQGQLTASYSANPFTLQTGLASNTGGLAPGATTVCIPLASNSPICAGSGFLQGEISPPDDTFSVGSLAALITANASSPAGSLAPYQTSVLTDVTLGSNEAIAYTAPTQGFLLPNPSAIPPGTNPVTTFVTCDINSKDIITGAACNGVTVLYSVQSTSDTTPPTSPCNAAAASSGSLDAAGYLCNQFQVNVNATTSLWQGSAPILSILSNTSRCVSCHSPPLPSNCPTGSGALANCKWWVVDSPAPVVSQANASGTLATLTNANNPAGTTAGQPYCVLNGTPCITPGYPNLSQLYINVCHTTPTTSINQGHGPQQADNSSDLSQALTASECATLSQWITEGANAN
jgi:hypothetical protein